VFNIKDIIVILVIGSIIALSIMKIVKEKRKGVMCVGCGGCPNKNVCPNKSCEK